MSNAADLLNTILLGAIVGAITLASGYLKAPAGLDQVVPVPQPQPAPVATVAPAPVQAPPQAIA